MLAQKNAYIENAYQQLKVISQDREKQLEYEAREKAIRDYNQMMHEAKTSGMEQGFQEGMEEGFKQGIEQGIEQSIRIFIASYLEDGVSKEKILSKLQRKFNLSLTQAKRYFP